MKCHFDLAFKFQDIFLKSVSWLIDAISSVALVTPVIWKETTLFSHFYNLLFSPPVPFLVLKNVTKCHLHLKAFFFSCFSFLMASVKYHSFKKLDMLAHLLEKWGHYNGFVIHLQVAIWDIEFKGKMLWFDFSYLRKLPFPM